MKIYVEEIKMNYQKAKAEIVRFENNDIFLFTSGESYWKITTSAGAGVYRCQSVNYVSSSGVENPLDNNWTAGNKIFCNDVDPHQHLISTATSVTWIAKSSSN